MHNHADSVGSVMFVERNSIHQETQAKKSLSLVSPRFFEDQGSWYPLRVSKVTLYWTGPVKILPKGQLESNIYSLIYNIYRVFF